MSKKYVIWDKVSDVYTPSGKVFTPDEWVAQYGWIKLPDAIPVVSAGMFNGAFSGELHALQNTYKSRGCVFEDNLSPQQILDKIEEFEEEREAKRKENEAVIENTPSAEERIAAALEYQNLATLM